jgi:hypothetical protein
MRYHLSLIFVFGAALILSSAIAARDMQTLEKSAPGNADIKRVNLEADIGVAELFITTHDGGDVYTVDVRFDADEIEVEVEFERTGSSADLYLFSEKIDKDLDIDTDDSRWRVSLSRDYTWDIELDLGVTEGKIDLSGLPVAELSLDQGVADCRVYFAEPNPIKMRRMSVDAGVGDLEIMGLGYAGVEDMSFDGGTGDFLLNFDGFRDGFRSARVDVGVGSVTIEIPRDLPVRIESDEGWLNSVSVPRKLFDEVDDDVYETEDFEEAEYGLDIELDIGIGSASIEVSD